MCVCVSADEMVREDTEHIHKMTWGEEADACVLVCSWYKREKLLLSHSQISVISAAHSCHHGNQRGSRRERERMLGRKKEENKIE